MLICFSRTAVSFPALMQARVAAVSVRKNVCLCVWTLHLCLCAYGCFCEGCMCACVLCAVCCTVLCAVYCVVRCALCAVCCVLCCALCCVLCGVLCAWCWSRVP